MSSVLQVRLAVLVLIALVGFGVLGYQRLEGWPLFDALYMTVITLSTVGFTEVHRLSPEGRAFTILLIVIGVSTVGVLARGLAETVADQRLVERRRRGRMEKRIGSFREHTIICGYGRMGQEIAREFNTLKLPYVVIEIEPTQVSALTDAGIPHVIGDATDDASLHAAGIARARALVAVAHTDADNIFIVLSARTLNPNLRIVARSILVEDEHKLRRAGADRVVSPYVIGARTIAGAILRPDVVDFLDLQALGAQSEMEAITVTATSPFCDHTLAETKIRERTGCTIVAVRPREVTGTARRFDSNPSPTTLLREGDVLIALGTPDQLGALEALARRKG